MFRPGARILFRKFEDDDCHSRQWRPVASVSHAEDLAMMIASAVDNANAKDEIFNCVTQKGVTLRGMAEVCAKAMGKEATIVTYKESVEGVETKKQFPFRAVHLRRGSDGKLGWEPKHPDLEAT